VLRNKGALMCLLLSVVFLAAGADGYGKGKGFLYALVLQADEEWEGSWVKDVLQKEEETDHSESAEETFSFAAWTERRGEWVTVPFCGRECKMDVTAVCGNSFCLLPFGKSLSIEDTQGCVIGTEAAEQLFGSHRAEGQEIAWQGRVWVVRDVLEDPSDLLLLQASGMAGEISFDRIGIALPSGCDRKMAGEAFISRFALSAQTLRWDYLYSFAWLVEMIPGKWSDFDGWRQNFKILGEETEWIRQSEKSIIERTGLRYCKKGLGFLGLGTVFFILSFYLFKPRATIRITNWLK